MNKSKGHVEFIGKHEYFTVDGLLYRALIASPLVAGVRKGEFVTLGSGITFALKLAREVPSK